MGALPFSLSSRGLFWVVEEDSTVQGWGWGELEGPWQVLGDRVRH